MALTPLRVLLFAAGVLIAGTGTAYFAGALDPVVGPIAETLLPGAEQPADSAQPEAEAPQGAETPSAATADAGGANVVVPSFDLLRAEPDGSLVVAGRAAPGAEVQVLSGSSVLATTKAGPTGDFAAVLDQALEPGEHNIVLRGTAPDNVAATSLETAIVSIPSDDSGEVVALVQQPGEPSRLISAPAPEATAESGAEQSGEEKAAEGTPDTQPPAVAQAAPEEPAAAAEAPSDRPVSEQAAAGTDDGQKTATTETQSGEAPPAAETQPFIEAVEIDGREVFVAGRATPGHRVNVYANDILLGQAVASPDGRFLVEAERDLPVGDYIIRADVLAEDGVTVIARAAVPFERQTGENIAALAPGAAARLQPPADTPAQQGTAGRVGTTQDTSQPSSSVTLMPDEAPGAAVGGNEAAPDATAEAKPGSQSTAAPETGATPGAATTPSDATTPPSTGSSTATATIKVVSPPLQAVDGAVIIRRGDTLWQLSRRVYGRGMRYTTIYLANQDQISDPDRIWPGQTFVVPDKTEEGEKADLEAVGEQVVPPAASTN